MISIKTGKDVIEFIQNNHLEDFAFDRDSYPNTLNWSFILTKRNVIDYYIDIEEGIANITYFEWTPERDITGECTKDITAEEALKLRGLD